MFFLKPITAHKEIGNGLLHNSGEGNKLFAKETLPRTLWIYTDREAEGTLVSIRAIGIIKRQPLQTRR
jgi:hypothetical protein